MKKRANKAGTRPAAKKKVPRKLKPMVFEEINLADYPPGQEDDVPFEFKAKPGTDEAIREAMEYAKLAGLDKLPRSR